MVAYSLAEIQKHNNAGDCWIIVRNRVYDVTKYLDDHPGGVEIITDLAGMDSTEDYDDVGHSEEAHAELEKCYIGDVEGTAAVNSTAPVQHKTSSPVPPAVIKPSAPKKAAEGEDSSATMMIAGALAVAGVAFFLLKKKK